MISKAFKHAYARKLGKNRKKGATLMETIAVLAIIGMLAATALVMWNSANTSRQTTTALTQLNQIQTAVRNLYAGQANYTGLSNATLINAKSLQQSMIASTTSIRHSFSGEVTVTPTTVAGIGGFIVQYDGIPKDACAQLLTKDLGRGVYEAGTTTAKRTQTGAQGATLPFPLAAANTACAGTYNTLTWTFI
jgi:Tfp pilus assembly protein PilE|nr:type 4 pilus major pilin [Neorhizobium tomejilense]